MRDFVKQRNVFESRIQSDETVATNAVANTSASPTLYDEMKVMSELSALIYTVAYLLDTIGKGGYPMPAEQESSGWFSSWFQPEPVMKQLEKTELVLSPECTIDGGENPDCHITLQTKLPAIKIFEFIMANQEALSQDPEITGETEAEDEISPKSLIVLTAIENIKAHQDQSYLWRMDHHFGNTDLVYAVTVNRTLKRVTVAFRGSSNKNDWWQNVQVTLATLRTPDLLKQNLNFEEEIKVHGGFMRYLLDDDVAKLELSEEAMRMQRPGKYGRILVDLEECFNHEENGVKVHQGFQLYVTGHSLGGALSTFLAMKLSCSWIVQEKIKPAKPIINISVASPYVGNEGFVNATKRLEQEGWLRHVRVTNEGDVVPVAPPKHFLYNAVYEPYLHTGCNVHLMPGVNEHEIGFGKERSFYSQVFWDSSTRHTPADYWNRQNEDKEAFQKLSVEGLYEQQSTSAPPTEGA